MRNHSEFSDSELLDLLKREGDTAAFEEIYNRYWDKCYGAAFKRLRSNEIAEEIVQDVFTDLWSRRETIVINTLVPVYLYTAIRYRVINYVHKEMVKNSYEQMAVHTIQVFDNSTEESIIASDLNNRIQTQVELLPIKCREVFELSRVDHMTNKEIAQSLGISEKTVENQITKALRRLRTSLNNFLFF